MAKVQREQPKQRGASTAERRRAQDICGLTLCFLGIAGLVCLIWPQGAIIPSFVERGLRVIAGVGAYAVPVLLLFAGAMFLRGYQRLSLSHSSYGSLLLLLVCVTWRHLAIVPDPAYWTSAQVQGAGGWLGGLSGMALYLLVGRPIGYLALVTMTLIATVLIVDQPFIEIVRWLHARSRDGARAAKDRLTFSEIQAEQLLAPENPPAPVRARAAKSPDNKIADNAGEERAVRAARVVERALASAPREPEMETAPEHPHTRSRFPNLFNLTRHLWDNRNAAEDEEDEEDAEYREDAERENAARENAEDEEISLQEAAPELPPREKRRRAASGRQQSSAEPAQHNEPAAENAVQPSETRQFALPPLTLLNEAPVATAKRSQSELTDNGARSSRRWSSSTSAPTWSRSRAAPALPAMRFSSRPASRSARSSAWPTTWP
jgi:hypothetical protein